MPKRSMGLRRSVLGERKKKGGGGWRGNWRDRFTIPKGFEAAILLCPGEYLDEREDSIKDNDGEPPLKHYYVYPHHTLKDGKIFWTGRCRCEFGEDGECLGCYQNGHGDKRIGKPREKFNFNILHIAPYMKLPLKDGKGKTVKFREDGENHKRGDTIMSWQEVTTPRELKEIEQYAEEMIEDGDLRVAMKKYLEVGSGHLEHLMGIDEYASKMCICGGKLNPTAFSCQGCDDLLCDVYDENMSPDAVVEYSKQRQRCGGCGKYDFANIKSDCDECDEPKALTAFDVVAYVRRQGEGTNSTIVIDKVVPLSEYELADGSFLVEMEEDDDEQLVPVYTDADEFEFVESIGKLVSNQFDFTKVNPKLDNDELAKKMRVDNVFGSSGSSKSQGRRYSRHDNDDDDTDDTDDPPRKRRSSAGKTKRRRPASRQ